jgi:hypothetical protein
MPSSTTFCHAFFFALPYIPAFHVSESSLGENDGFYRTLRSNMPGAGALVISSPVETLKRASSHSVSAATSRVRSMRA